MTDFACQDCGTTTCVCEPPPAATVRIPPRPASRTAADFADALDVLDTDVSRLAESAELADLLRLLGQLQTFAGRLADVVAYAEHVALQSGARSGTLDDGTRVERVPGRWTYTWDGHHTVIGACAPELLAELDRAGAGDLAGRLVDRIAAMLPAGVKWKSGEVNRYALASELRTGEKGRDTLKVTPAP